MRLDVHGECVYCLLYLEVLNLAIAVWIILMNNGNGSALTGRINPMQTGVKLDYIPSVRQLEKRDGLMFAVQRTYSRSFFESGKERTFEGVIEASPYPILLSSPDVANASASRYLLVANGKHGADSQVAAYTGKRVRLRGRLIYRDDQKMIVLSDGSIVVFHDAQQNQVVPKSLGEFDLVGEIVDSKCYLGNMNPDNGKVHRDCAVRCLSGGISPVFATNDFNGSPAVLLLTGPNQKRLPRELHAEGCVGRPRARAGRNWRPNHSRRTAL